VDNIREVLLRHKWSLAKIYAYVFLERVLLLLEPMLLGKSIDGLLAKDDFSYLGLLLLAFLAESTFLYKRMVLDTKVYMQVYNEIIFDYLQRNKEAPASMRVARTEMAHSIVDFVENDLLYLITSVISTLGTLLFIYSGSFFAGVVVTLGAIPTVLFTKLFMPKIDQINRISHDHYEGKVEAVSSGDDNRIKQFFLRRKRILVLYSTVHGKQWAGVSAAKSVFLLLAVAVYTQSDSGLTQGEAVTMYSYTNQFFSALFAIPVAGSVITRMRDTLRRLKESV
jgi:ABC-type bacteriocin/lantibiotic exporter with double-glycine peptidase domain